MHFITLLKIIKFVNFTKSFFEIQDLDYDRSQILIRTLEDKIFGYVMIVFS